ncbi:hypothetical protein D3C81_2076030 [compost metagenome]
MPGIPAQIERNAVQHKLRAFTPEFAETEYLHLPVNDHSAFEQLQLRSVQKR